MRKYFKEKISQLATNTVRKGNIEKRNNLLRPKQSLAVPGDKGSASSKSGSQIGSDSPKMEVRNFNDYREKKNRQWNFEMSIKQEVEGHAKSIDKMMKQHTVLQGNDQLVKNSLQAQQDALKEKLKQRRERSFQRSMNKGDLSTMDDAANRAAEYGLNRTVEVVDEETRARSNLAHNILKLLEDMGPDPKG